MKTKVRKCNIDDVHDLIDVAVTTFVETFLPKNSQRNIDKYVRTAFSTSQIMDEMYNPHSQFFLIYYDEKIAGYMKINTGAAQTEPHGNKAIEIQRLYILDKFKRMGLGSDLMSKAIAIAKNTHKDEIWLGVWEHNQTAQDFYTTFGFAHTGDHPFKIGTDVQHDWIMTKSIAS
ncbi:GNAT family N-acetyltransferase [Lentilactobacillus sp. Marseille-Q4993]|uniref:GNAT family N-acetyltransferase n=1 Tax=Lentilactobacillus sp. Marseille-Q4993 TaxID=3039492 RepID=UPI0024BC903D|nr:GNAT family N-acetyltransferase [Lentilactobacillus sp. Marseille-Q4993]